MNTALRISVLLLSALFSGVLPAEERPNILFIMVDDLGKEWISCYGADAIETPRVDALAKSGMRFTNAYSMPQCTPTRATLLTGQYPWRTGWVNHWDVPRWGVGFFDWREYTTFARIVKRAGYRTAIAGKWQINDFRLEPNALKKHGFDDWCVWTGFEGANPPSAERYRDPYVHTRDGSRTLKGEFGPDVFANFLIDFMKRHRAEPMLVYFPMVLTHGPLVPTPAEPKASTVKEKHRAMVRYTDRLVGRLVDALGELGIRERTIVFFTTDNGSGRGIRGSLRGKPVRGGKGTKVEAGVCEPFIVSCPGLVPGGVVTDALTDFSDMLPTFAEIAGARLPDELELDGRSIAPLILGKTRTSSREWIMALGHGPARLDSKGVRGRVDYTPRVIRDERFKVWVSENAEIERLHDLKVDPFEAHPIPLDSTDADHCAALAKFRAVVESMPKLDARPRYRKRATNAWDRALPGS